MPRIDSRCCFARLLDWQAGGHCRIAPATSYRVERRYREDSLILETTFRSERGTVRVVDCLPMREGGRLDPYQQILRVIEGREGDVPVRIDIVPRFDYGSIEPWIRQFGESRFHAVGGGDGLLVSADLELIIEERHSLACEYEISAGERRHLSIVYARPEDLEDDLISTPSADEVCERLEATERWWRRWAAQSDARSYDHAQSRRSAIVLKGLTHAPTGAVAAAATTSLPESPGGSRNWDYRFTWVRDSVFTVRSLLELGFAREADGFRRFVERSTAGNAEQVQVLYGVDGRRRLDEQVIPELGGYQGAAPVRIGNAAAGQLQLDVFGELLDLAYSWHQQGNSPDEEYWEFIVKLVERTIALWREPDRGIWEMRGPPRHFVHSKALCWSALDRGIHLAEELDRDVKDLPRWRDERDRVRAAVESEGYDAERGVFTQAFGYRDMDAALLLLPVFGFVAFDDERMVRTTDAVRTDLSENGFLRRYSADGDGLEGHEGAFIACTFWLAECLARQGRAADARTVYATARSARNDLGLYSEEYDVTSGTMLGNFPQGLTHLSQIAAAVAIGAIEKHPDE
jgi:GH15 family glucan-1,4-alpha-glucosidase